jgi:uncharacterized membrane protein
MSRRQGEPGSDSRKVDIVTADSTVEARPLPSVLVSDVKIGEHSVSFSVDRTGVPILVRVSYFPNWRVEGADGPYRVAPNMMVVVPMQKSVSMEFVSSNMDRFAYVLTLIGFGVVIVMYRARRRERRRTSLH